jgi:hypothetical protein
MPKTVKVGVHTYTILRKTKAQMTVTDGTKDEGRVDPNTLEIWIRKGLKRSKAREALWHEVKHTATYPEYWDVKLTDEAFIEGTAPRELQIMQDNPELLEYLTQ